MAWCGGGGYTAGPITEEDEEEGLNIERWRYFKICFPKLSVSAVNQVTLLLTSYLGASIHLHFSVFSSVRWMHGADYLVPIAWNDRPEHLE